MTRVLLIGLDSEAVGFFDPDLPLGSTAERIAAVLRCSTAFGFDRSELEVLVRVDRCAFG